MVAAPPNRTASTIASPAQNGAVTHHQLQSMTPQSLRMTKAIPSKGRMLKDTGFEMEVDLLMAYLEGWELVKRSII